MYLITYNLILMKHDIWVAYMISCLLYESNKVCIHAVRWLYYNYKTSRTPPFKSIIIAVTNHLTACLIT